MTHISVERLIQADPDRVWRMLRTFRLDYFKGFPHTVSGSGVGARRTFNLPDGEMTEVIHVLDDRRMSLQYQIVQGPWPVKDYTAQIAVTPAEGGSRVVWSAEFEPDGVEEDRALQIVEGTFSMNLRAIEKLFSQDG